MRSVVFGNLTICKHVFDNYLARFPGTSYNLNNRDDRIKIARFIRSAIDQSVKVKKPNGQVIFVHTSQDGVPIAYPADISRTSIKIVTSYRASRSLVHMARNVDGDGVALLRSDPQG